MGARYLTSCAVPSTPKPISDTVQDDTYGDVSHLLLQALSIVPWVILYEGSKAEKPP